MKKICAILMLALAFIACGSDEDIINEQQSVGAKTYTMTVQASKGGDTRALASCDNKTLNATWTENDAVTVYKGDSELGTLYAQESGESTTLKGNLTGTIVKDDVLTLKFLSPSYSTQNGTLAYIAANCDYATATVTVKSISGNNITINESSADFENQQAIVKFTLKNKANDNAISVTPLQVSDGTNTYTITPASGTSEIYVAMPGFSGNTVSLTATAGGKTFRYQKANITFSNGKYYEVMVKMTEATAMADATSDHVGKVIAADGYIYNTVSAATGAGTTASGVVAYVGSAGSVETNTSYKGIALSLTNVYDTWQQHYYMRYCGQNANCSGCTYCSTFSSALSAKNGISATTGAVKNNENHEKNHEATKYARNLDNTTIRPAGTSAWSVPSLGQWNLILKGLTGSNSNLSESWVSTFTNSNVSTKITAAGGSELNWAVYWSSTESSDSNVWCLSFNNNNGCHAINHTKEEATDTYCRAFFAF